MVNWEDLKYFDAVARWGSVRRAAAALGVNPSTVTRRVEQLERQVGVSLFARTRRGLVLTADAAEAAVSLKDVANRLQSVEDRLGQQSGAVRGEVRCSVPDYLPTDWWMPELTRLTAEYPELVVKLIESPQLPNLASKEADLALIAGNGLPESLIARPLGHLAFRAFRHVSCTNEVWLASTLEAVVASDHHTGARVAAVLPSVALQMAAVEAGMGASLLPCAMADGRSQLVRDENGPEVNQPLWLLSHPDSRQLVRVQVVAEALTGAVRVGAAGALGDSA